LQQLLMLLMLLLLLLALSVVVVVVVLAVQVPWGQVPSPCWTQACTGPLGW
jgi:hypothetical protein